MHLSKYVCMCAATEQICTQVWIKYAKFKNCSMLFGVEHCQQTLLTKVAYVSIIQWTPSDVAVARSLSCVYMKSALAVARCFSEQPHTPCLTTMHKRKSACMSACITRAICLYMGQGWICKNMYMCQYKYVYVCVCVCRY